MSDPESAPGGAGEQQSDDARQVAARRRRLAEVFGDVLPETTQDEQGGRDSNDERLRSDVPPHH